MRLVRVADYMALEVGVREHHPLLVQPGCFPQVEAEGLRSIVEGLERAASRVHRIGVAENRAVERQGRNMAASAADFSKQPLAPICALCVSLVPAHLHRYRQRGLVNRGGGDIAD